MYREPDGPAARGRPRTASDHRRRADHSRPPRSHRRRRQRAPHPGDDRIDRQAAGLVRALGSCHHRRPRARRAVRDGAGLAERALTGWPAQEARRAPHAMIACVNPLASAAGLRVLRDGGNATDAAIAAGAVLTVVEPWSGQLGGDAFLLVASTKRGTLTAINGSGAAPHQATLDRYQALGRIPQSGWLAASVPGIVDAWQVAVDRFGTRPLGTLLGDAIEYAEAGFPLTARQARQNAEMAAISAEFPDTRAVFFPDGRPPGAGFPLRQPDLARTLRIIQAEGAAAFYRGTIARAIVAASERGGGLFSERDLAEYRTDVLDPIQATYRGWTVLEQPPVSQGLIVLIALKILEGLAPPTDPTDRVHLQVEAHKLALAERLKHVGDPA